MGQYNGTYTTLGAGTGYVLVASSSGLPVYDQSTGQQAFQAAYPAAKGALNLTQEAPFVISTGSTTINGQAVSAGVYMNTAMIADATITQAQIGTLNADVINSGLLNTVDFYGNTIAGSTIYLGGEITYLEDPDGNPIGIQSVADANATLSSSGINFTTSAFTISNGDGTDYTPFQVVDGVVYISDAILGDIESSNYSDANNTGWKLSRNGNLDLNSATITAGVLQSSDGNFEIDLTNGTITISA
jgi:hypothetical protein